MNKNLEHKLSFYILCIFCIGFPFYSWFGTWCLIALAIVWLVGRFQNSWKPSNKLHWPFLIYFGLHLIGMLYTENQLAGWQDLQSKSGFLLVPIILSYSNFSKEEMRKLLWCFVIGIIATALIYLAFAGYQYIFNGRQSKVFFYTHLTIPFKNHPAYTSSYSIFALLIVVYHFVKQKSIPYNVRIILSTAALFLWFMVILFAGRMQILIMITIVPLFLIFLFWKTKWKWYNLIVSLTFIGATIFTFTSFSFTAGRLDNAMKSIEQNDEIIKEQPNDRNIRFQLWDTAFDVFKENWILGVGTGDNKAKTLALYEKKEYEYAFKHSLVSHNQYLESMVTLGIFGLFSYWLLLFIPSLNALKAGNVLIISFYLIFALGTLTECMLETQRGSVWLAVFGSLFWGREDFLND